MAFNRAQHCRKIARLGGRALVEKHGREHMQAIGRRGFQALVDRHYGGDVEAAKRALVHMYWQATGLPMKYDFNGKAIW